MPGVISTAVGTPPDDTRYPTFAHGDMFFNGTDYNTPVKGNFAYATVIHEMGHALGLKHGHITQPSPGESFVIPALPAAHDSMEFSIMTYRSNVGGPTNFYRNEQFGYAQSWMMNDIAALQYLYGADFTANASNTKYGWNRTTGDDVHQRRSARGLPGANRVVPDDLETAMASTLMSMAELHRQGHSQPQSRQLLPRRRNPSSRCSTPRTMSRRGAMCSMRSCSTATADR